MIPITPEQLRERVPGWAAAELQQAITAPLPRVDPVTVALVDGTATTTTLVTLDPAEWTADDARRFVWDVWRLLLTTAGERLQLRELTPYGSWRLEFVADTGTAVTGPLRLSDRALEWIQTATFRVPVGGTTH